MRRSVTWQALAIASAAAAAAALVPGALAAPAKPAAAKPTVINVTATEFKFALSKNTVPVGTKVTFKVTNRGKIAHDFKIFGKQTPSLAPGKSATFTVTFTKKGQQAYLCTIPGHAPAGMKGNFGVGVTPTAATSGGGKLPSTTTSPAAATTSAPATTAPAAATTSPAPAPAGPEALGGDPAAGAQVFAANGCGSCHTLAAAGANGSVGPNLDAIKPSQSLVKAVVPAGATAGGAVMPQFNLSPTDLNNLAAYVYQSTHQ